MSERERHSGMPRALPSHPERSANVVWVIAALLAVVFAFGQVLGVATAAPMAIAYHDTGVVPWFVGFAARLGVAGLVAVLLVLDAVVLAVFVWLARRHWIGFAYVPPMLYLGIGVVIVWLLVAEGFSAVFLRG